MEEEKDERQVIDIRVESKRVSRQNFEGEEGTIDLKTSVAFSNQNTEPTSCEKKMDSKQPQFFETLNGNF